MRAVSVLVVGLVLCFVAPALSRVLFIDQFPHFQTFDNFDLCYYDGTCYENRCDNLYSGWYNPLFRSEKPDGSVRHWWVIDQQTPSNWALNTRIPVDCANLKTGPCADHTSGVAGDGKYLYAEATACFGVEFQVVSPTFLFNNSGAQISYWYYMDGNSMDATASLQLQLSINNGTWTSVGTPLTGRQGKQWNYINHEVAAIIGNNATSADPTPVTFRFVATTTSSGTPYYSDIAIDDIYVTQDGAPNTSEPYIEPNETRPPPILPSPEAKEEGGDGLTDEEIIGIVIGIVGGACCLCCLLCLCLLALLLIISPRKPPEEQASGGGL